MSMSLPNTATRVYRIVQELMEISYKVHPNYTRDEHWAWISGLLAECMLEKNYMDNIVFAKFNAKLNSILEEDRYGTNQKRTQTPL